MVKVGVTCLAGSHYTFGKKCGLLVCQESQFFVFAGFGFHRHENESDTGSLRMGQERGSENLSFLIYRIKQQNTEQMPCRRIRNPELVCIKNNKTNHMDTTAYGIDNLMNLIYYVFIRIVDILCLVKEKMHFFMKMGGLPNKFLETFPFPETCVQGESAKTDRFRVWL